MKKTIKMNEQELHKLISESVKRVLNEGRFDALDCNAFGSYDLAYAPNTPETLARKIEILDNFGGALSSAIQMYLANVAGMFKKSHPYVYKELMDIRSNLIHAGGCSIVSTCLGLQISDNSESDADYYREMQQAEYLG